METKYTPDTIEAHWSTRWEQQGYFRPSGDGPSYSIVIPPPNITGRLHMGHGFQNTLMDALTRYHRMRGFNTLWQPGTDHAGISTQMVVERQLNQQGISRHDLGREKFVEKIWEWQQVSGGNICGQLRRLGASVDWTRERFTMDEGCSKAVQEEFIRLYDEGLIYRGKKLVNWDPKLLTAISDVEVDSIEETGSLWHIRYPVVDSEEYIIVATTRPETMLGDTAVAIHPEDDRYKHLLGKHVQLPLTDRTIPVIADDYVDPEFGTGCVKITPAHDFNDYAIGKRHDLPLINILTPEAHLNDNVPAVYQGLERFAARKQIVADLTNAKLLEKTEPHQLKVPKGDRSGVVIEPYLTDQWFVRAEPLAKPAIEAVEQGKVKFIPEVWTKTYYQWMYNIEDWCISRQLWWGHRIPAWFDEAGDIYVAEDEATVRAKYQLADDMQLSQETDVLDTWFSSALWPFSTLGWPEQKPELATFYPTSVLVTGFDIIFFWVARMMMMGIKFMDDIPFHEVYITGLIRDAEGQKMSKTKGNVLDPIDLIDGIELDDLIEKRVHGLMQPAMAESIKTKTKKEFPNGIAAHGTDALRFTFCALASTGRDINFDLHRLEGYRNFCNKIWNAARYVLMNCENQDTGSNNDDKTLSLADRWIQTKLQQTIASIHEHFKHYRFDLAAQALYEFTWNEYCDWYLELSKPVLLNTDSSEALKRGTRYTLVTVLESLLRLMHPIMPYITEEIWQRIAPLAGKQGDTIMLQAYPEYAENLVDEAAIADVEWLKQFIISVRTIRGEMNIAPSKALPVLLRHGNAQDQQRLADNQAFLQTLAKLASIQWLESTDEAPQAATALVGEMEILIPLAGLIDVSAELVRLEKEMDKLDKELQRTRGKLSNPNFVDKAPEAVVAKEKQRLTENEAALQQLQQQHDSLQSEL